MKYLNMLRVKVALKKFSTCIGVIWLGGRFIPLKISGYIGISILSDVEVLICGIFLFLYFLINDSFYLNAF